MAVSLHADDLRRKQRRALQRGGICRQTAQGPKPADLPSSSHVIELIINLKTAGAGKHPTTLLAQAHELIE